MRPAKDRGTIVVFARAPVAGQTKTRLVTHLGTNGAAALASAFTFDTLTKVRTTGWRIVIAGAAAKGVSRSAYFRQLARKFGATLIDQGEGTLGARMQRSLRPFCAAGAVLIGTDIPSLPISILERSLRMARQRPVILAPSVDGGYYLVGVHGQLPDIFHAIRWGGRHVLEETLRRLHRSNIDYALADAWHDIDRWSDLLVLVTELRLRAAIGTHPCPATAQILTRLGLLIPRR